MFDEIHAIIEKYRPHFREKFNIKISDKHFAHYKYVEQKNESRGFGVMLWLERENDRVQYENLVLDHPEHTVKIMMDRIQQTIKMIMDNEPDKNKATEMIKKGLGAQVIVGAGEFCDNPDCPVHGKNPFRKEKEIGIA